MMNVEPGRTDPRRDLLAIGVLTLLVAVLCVQLELGEAFFASTRQWERFQLDEWPAVLATLVLGLAWFAMRRYREARRELALRRAAEAQLGRLLTENRRLAQDHLRVQEAERKDLARELHDELGQYLNAIKTDAVSIQDKTGHSESTQRAAAAIVKHADHVESVVRDLIRKLRPVGLDELGFQAAIEHCLDHWQQRLPGTQLAASFEGDLDDLSEQIALALYRLVQEGLTNVATHSGARSARIRMARAEDGSDAIAVEIADDGRGADRAEKQTGLGLIGMRERVEMLGGTLHITTAPGKGFCVRARIPL